jgi:hypothetical protein
MVAVMAVLPQKDTSIGTAIVTFFLFLGGSIFLIIAENLFNSQLVKQLAVYAPNVDAQLVVAAGAAAVSSVISSDSLPAVLEAYNQAIISVFVSLLQARGRVPRKFADVIRA